MKKLLLSLLLPLFCGVAAEYRVRGKVVSPEMKNVAVCDGENFHPVKPDGTFDFKVDTICTAFVYLDFPGELEAQGRWSYPLQPGDNEVNFHLTRRRAVPETFTFAHGSDVQYDFKQPRLLAMLKEDMSDISRILRNYDARFITFPGDLTNFGDPEDLAILKREIDRTRMVYYPIYGGHDRLHSKPSFKNFTESFGAPYFGWHFGGIYFFAPASEIRSLAEAHEKVRQQNWMKNALDRLPPGTPLLLITHQPWYLSRMLTSMDKSGRIRLLGSLGAHTHYHNLYSSFKYPVLTVPPLRPYDMGNFTKSLRLVTINPNGIVNTRTILLNQHQRVEATLHGNRHILARVADSLGEIQEVSAVINGKTVKFVRKNELLWQGEYPGKLASGIKHKMDFTVRTSTGNFRRSTAIANTDNILWTAALPVFQRSWPEAAVSGNRLFIGVESGELPAGRGGVAAFDLHTGKPLWYHADSDVRCGVAADAATVRALTVDGELLTLDAATGKLLHRLQFPVKFYFRRSLASVTIVDGKVLAVYNEHKPVMFCVDARTNKIIWQKPIFTTAWIGVNYTVKDGVIYFQGGRGTYGAARLSDGEFIWKNEFKSTKTSAGNPLITDGAAYFAHHDRLFKTDAATGKIIWEQKGFIGRGITIGGLCLKEGKLVCTSAYMVTVTDAATGKRLYQINLPAPGVKRGARYQFFANSAEPVIFKDQVLIFGDNGCVYDLSGHLKNCKNQKDADKLPLKPLLDTGFAFKGDPLVHGGKVYFAGFDGVVYAWK